MGRFAKWAVLLGILSLVPHAAGAQQEQAAIVGVVKDASGAILPGVTVEASSPVLIEKVRTAVSDGSGQYRLVNMPQGTYTVTFALTGFSTYKREGIELVGALNATVNAEMKVGALEETITVSGSTPVVDVQSARRQAVISGDVLQNIPTSRSYNNVLQLVPSVDNGTSQVQLSPTMTLFTSHGGYAGDGRLTVDGLNTGASRGGGGVSGYVPDMQNTQEVALSVSGNLGEAETGGPQMSVIPKSGGNRFNGSFFATGFGESLQNTNLTSRVQAQGFTTAPPKIISLFDVQGSFGGPIKKDKLWFFYNIRDVGRADPVPGLYANKNAGNPNAWTYVPDFTQQARNDTSRFINALRLTWQITPRNKFSAFYDNQPQCTGAGWIDAGACRTVSPGTDGYIQGGSQINGFFGPGPNSPETGDYNHNWQRVQQAKWQSPVTNKLLVEAGVSVYASRWGYEERPGDPTANLVRVLEQGTIAATGPNGESVNLAGLKYRSSNYPNGRIGAHTWNATATYVTGANSLKVGYQGAFHRDIYQLFGIINNTQRLQYTFLNGNPQSLTMDSGPWTRQVRTQYEAAYAQDQWTRDRLTIQAALRFDHAWSYYPAQSLGPDRFIPLISFPQTDGITGYNDMSPRLGLAYDLRGNGKTSLKFNVGQYLQPASNQDRYILANPVSLLTVAGQSSVNVTRSWTDGNKNFNPDCDLLNPAAQDFRASGGDFCGPWSDQNFGKTKPVTQVDPGISSGWGVRPRDWQLGASVQQEIMPRVSVEVDYYRRWWRHFVDVTDNLVTSASDYNQYTVTAPSDSRLPGGGGYPVGPLFDITPTLFGKTFTDGRFSQDINEIERYGTYIRNWNGVDINASARLRGGLTLQGGTSTGKLRTDTCAVRSTVPEWGTGTLTNPFCNDVQPFLTQVKAIGTYIVPKIDVLFSGTFSSLPGPSLQMNVIYPATATSPLGQSLGRGIASGGATQTINVLPPDTLFGDRVNDLDLRIGKILKFGRTRSNVALDIVNALNADAILTYNPLLSPTWPTATGILQARLYRLSVQFDW